MACKPHKNAYNQETEEKQSKSVGTKISVGTASGVVVARGWEWGRSGNDCQQVQGFSGGWKCCPRIKTHELHSAVGFMSCELHLTSHSTRDQKGQDNHFPPGSWQRFSTGWMPSAGPTGDEKICGYKLSGKLFEEMWRAFEMASKHMKRCSTSLATRKRQLLGWGKEKMDNNKCW